LKTVCVAFKFIVRIDEIDRWLFLPVMLRYGVLLQDFKKMKHILIFNQSSVIELEKALVSYNYCDNHQHHVSTSMLCLGG